MRTLTDHLATSFQTEHLTINALDEPGVGGANHVYQITGFDLTKNPGDGFSPMLRGFLGIVFQNGSIKEAGVNGITHEALLAIVIDRLKSFQAGPFACEQNDLALNHCIMALFHLQERTRRRIERGVEGTTQK